RRARPSFPTRRSSDLILVRNVMVGFRTVDAAIIESGKGMGLSPAQLFWKIELPLAMPVILGGVRIAAVSTIGIATIAAWINAGGDRKSTRLNSSHVKI